MSVPASAISLVLGEASAYLYQSAQSPPTWGVFDSNSNLVVQPDSILDFDNKREWRVATYPLQDGQFQSFNKVLTPFENTLIMSKGGTVGARKTFLGQLDTVAGTLNLYSIVTPEWTYKDVNITRYEVARHGATGAFWLCEVTVYFVQVMLGAAQYASATQNASNPTSQPAVNNGTVSTQTPSLAASTAGAAALAFNGGGVAL